MMKILTNDSKNISFQDLTCCLYGMSTYLLYAPHLEWPWCRICECSGSTRSALGAPRPHLHFYVRLQSRNPTAGTQQREPSCPDPVEIDHTEIHIHVQACRKGRRNFNSITASNHCSFLKRLTLTTAWTLEIKRALTHNHSWNHCESRLCVCVLFN